MFHKIDKVPSIGKVVLKGQADVIARVCSNKNDVSLWALFL